MSGESKKSKKRKPPKSLWQELRKRGFKNLMRTYESPEALFEAAIGYIEWCEQNPIPSERVFKNGVVILNRRRAPSINGLCAHLGITKLTWANWRKKAGLMDFRPVVHLIDELIIEDKLSGGLAEVYNPALVARDLGLMERYDHTTNGAAIGGGTTNITIKGKKATQVDE